MLVPACANSLSCCVSVCSISFHIHVVCWYHVSLCIYTCTCFGVFESVYTYL